MKEHLINFLLEEYRQQKLIDEMEEKGIQLDGIRINNLDIVLDAIGFPKDNSREYDFTHLGTGDIDQELRRKIPDKDLFIRDWLINKYYDMIQEIELEQQISVSDKGLKLKNKNDENIARLVLDKYITWLYNEFDNYQKNIE